MKERGKDMYLNTQKIIIRNQTRSKEGPRSIDVSVYDNNNFHFQKKFEIEILHWSIIFCITGIS